MANAAAAGLEVVALTDHDSTEGWAEAEKAAEHCDIRLVKGIEISTRCDGKSIHLLGYEFDPTNKPLLTELGKVLDGRNSRLPATLERLRGLGIDIDAKDVRRHSANAAAMGRPHVADALVELGVVANRDEAFAHYLTPGKPAYVDRYAADLEQAIGLVKAAGGQTVLAHPWSRGSQRVLTNRASRRSRRSVSTARGRPQRPRRTRIGRRWPRSPGSSTSSVRVPATITAPARSASTSAATPQPATSSSDSSADARLVRARPTGRTARRGRRSSAMPASPRMRPAKLTNPTDPQTYARWAPKCERLDLVGIDVRGHAVVMVLAGQGDQRAVRLELVGVREALAGLGRRDDLEPSTRCRCAVA